MSKCFKKAGFLINTDRPDNRPMEVENEPVLQWLRRFRIPLLLIAVLSVVVFYSYLWVHDNVLSNIKHLSISEEGAFLSDPEEDPERLAQLKRQFGVYGERLPDQPSFGYSAGFDFFRGTLLVFVLDEHELPESCKQISLSDFIIDCPDHLLLFATNIETDGEFNDSFDESDGSLLINGKSYPYRMNSSYKSSKVIAALHLRVAPGRYLMLQGPEQSVTLERLETFVPRL